MQKHTVRTQHDLKKIEGLNFSQVAFDVETKNSKTDQLSVNWYDYEVFVLSLYVPGHSIIVVEPTLYKQVFDVFPSKALLIAHNITFDAASLKKHDVQLYNYKWFDTMVAAHLLDETRPFLGLKPLANTYLQAQTENIKNTYNPRNPYNKEFIEYARNDTIWAYKLAEKFWPELKKQGLDTLFKKVEMPFQRALVEMETNGIIYNEQKSREYRERCRNKLTNLKLELFDTFNIPYDLQSCLKKPQPDVISRFNINSVHDKRQLLYEDLQLPVINETSTGLPSTSSDTLRDLQYECENDEQRKALKILQTYNKGQKLLTSFFDSIPDYVDPDGRVRTNFRDVGTVTGRLTSSKPNMQQLPRKGWQGVNVRECFEPTPGKKLVAVDYSSQENRIAAHVTQDKELIKIIQNNIDSHLRNAAAISDIEITQQDMTRGSPTYKKTKQKHKDLRQKAKIFTYGILFGATKYKVSEVFDCSLEQAERYVEKFYEEFPGIKTAKDKAWEQVQRNGYVRSIYGRKRRFDKEPNPWTGRMEYPNSAQREAFNFLVQSPASDMLRVACIKIMNYKHRNPEMGLNLLLVVHDEVVFEVNEEYAEKACEDVEQLMSSVVGKGFAVSMPAEGDIGDNYGEAK